MLRRTFRVLELHTTTQNTPSFRAAPMRNLLGAVVQSPFKDSFKEFWSTPVPWAQRDYGPKPKIGDPIPLREATTMLCVGRNNHIDPAKVETGEDNDYKVLMMFREPLGRYTKDQFILPSAPVCLADRDEDWGPLLMRLGVKTPHSDLTMRIAAIRALLVEANMLVLPENDPKTGIPHGGLAEVQGPPGGKNWHMMIMSQPSLMRQFCDILELPMEGCFQRLLPFVRVQTPNTEQFRFDSLAYITTFDKLPCVKYTVSAVGEQLFWVSPKEALARYEAGVMELPTPTIILFNELCRHFPKFDDINKKLTMDTEPRVITPELVHDPVTRMASVLMPGDIHHSETPKLRQEFYERKKKEKEARLTKKMAAAMQDGAKSEEEQEEEEEEEEKELKFPDMWYRVQYEKDEPYGVKSVLCYRPVIDEDDTTPLPAVAEKLIEEDAPQLQTLEGLKREEEEYHVKVAAAQSGGKNMQQKMTLDQMHADMPVAGVPPQG